MAQPRRHFVTPGQRFGRLVVVRELPPTKPGGDRRVECRCDCGERTVPILRNLATGRTKSCGCGQREWIANAPHDSPAIQAWRRSAANKANLTRWRNDPATRAKRDATDAPRLRAMARIAAAAAAVSPVAIAARRQNIKVATAAYWAMPRLGSAREPVDAPDPDWCLHHGLSRYDHQANSRCRYEGSWDDL